MADDARAARAEAAAEKARLKALRPWYKKKRFLLPLALIVLVVLAVAAGGGDKAADKAKQVASDITTPDTVAVVGPDDQTGDQAGQSATNRSRRRADRQREDQEVPIGGSVRLSGYTATVTAATFTPELSQFEDDGYLVAEVTVVNRDDEAQPYNTFDWKLQTPNGQVIDPSFTGEKQLGSGDLVQGGSVSGKVIWEVGATRGEFIIIYKPDAFDAARGLWKVTV